MGIAFNLHCTIARALRLRLLLMMVMFSTLLLPLPLLMPSLELKLLVSGPKQRPDGSKWRGAAYRPEI